MPAKVRWGVLGVAKIATVKVIPAMQRSEWSQVVAIASRDPDKARRAAADLGIPKAYGSYETLLADPEIESIYIPLPNHRVASSAAGSAIRNSKPQGSFP